MTTTAIRSFAQMWSLNYWAFATGLRILIQVFSGFNLSGKLLGLGICRRVSDWTTAD